MTAQRLTTARVRHALWVMQAASPGAEDLLRDPRGVPPGYFTGIHEMGHALDLSGGMGSNRDLGDVILRAYHENNPQDPPWKPGSPRKNYTTFDPKKSPVMAWMRNQLPRAAFDGEGYLNKPEVIAHAFTEMKLNPQGASPAARAIYDHLLKNVPEGKGHGGLSVGQGVPQSTLDAIHDVQSEHPQADLSRVDLSPEDQWGPAWVEGTHGQPPRMRIDQQYADPADPTKFRDWFDDRIDEGHYPRWQSTTAGEPWPEDSIEDLMTEFDLQKGQKAAAASLPRNDPAELPYRTLLYMNELMRERARTPEEKAYGQALDAEVSKRGTGMGFAAARADGMGVPSGYQVRKIKPINPYDSDFAAGLFAPDDDEPASTLEWSKDGEVKMIRTRPEYRAEHGLATSLFNHARDHFDPQLHHSEQLSPDGAAWSKKMYDWDPSPGGKDSVYSLQFNAALGEYEDLSTGHARRATSGYPTISGGTS